LWFCEVFGVLVVSGVKRFSLFFTAGWGLLGGFLEGGLEKLKKIYYRPKVCGFSALMLMRMSITLS